MIYVIVRALGILSMPHVTVIVAKQLTRVVHHATTAIYRKYTRVS